MKTLNYYATLAFIAAGIMLLFAIKIESHIVTLISLPAPPPCQGPCDNTNRFPSGMISDGCKTITQNDAQTFFNAFKEAGATSGLSNQRGAWIGKDLIDKLFTCNTNNGAYILMGLDKTTSPVKVCFMLIGGRSEKFKTTATANATTPYYRLDAMCPALCDGLTP